MSAETKTYEDKMTGVINHLVKEHATIRAGRANPAILDKVTVDYYGTPTPINQVAAVSVAEARVLTISPWDASGFPGSYGGTAQTAHQGSHAHG